MATPGHMIKSQHLLAFFYPLEPKKVALSSFATASRKDTIQPHLINKNLFFIYFND
jgi:hypothetical protein